MNSDQIMSLARSVLMAAGSLAVGKGLLDQSTLVTIVGGVLALGSVVWSQFTHKAA